MLAGIRSVVSQPQQVPQAPPTWQTRFAQHDDKVPCVDWLLACCCTPCASSAAKSHVDRSSLLYNFLCWNPIATHSYVRHAYHIDGVCGDDLMYGLFCMPCTVRQMYTESNLRGPIPGNFGANQGDWAHSLFDCSVPEMLDTICCVWCITHTIRKQLQPSTEENYCFFDMCCLLPFAMYGQVRHTYGIISDVSLCEDICVPVVCWPCALNRAKKETIARCGGAVKSAYQRA